MHHSNKNNKWIVDIYFNAQFDKDSPRVHHTVFTGSFKTVERKVKGLASELRASNCDVTSTSMELIK